MEKMIKCDPITGLYESYDIPEEDVDVPVEEVKPPEQKQTFQKKDKNGPNRSKYNN